MTEKRWQCDGCQKLHIDYASAQCCCPPRPVAVFVCTDCGNIFSMNKDAEKCLASHLTELKEGE